MSYYALCAYEMTEYTTNKDNKNIVYGDTLNKWAKMLPKAGSLVGNHLLGIAVLVDIVSSWFIYCFVSPGVNLPLKYFRNNYNILIITSHLQILLKSIAATIELKFGIHASCQRAKNIICKVFWVLNPNTEESIYRDHHIKGMTLVWMEPRGKSVVRYVNGEEMTLLFVIDLGMGFQWEVDILLQNS